LTNVLGLSEALKRDGFAHQMEHQFPVLRIGHRKKVAQFGPVAGALSAKKNVVPPGFRQLWSGWLFTVVEEPVQRNLQRFGQLFNSLDGGNGMASFNARYVTSLQSPAILDISLRDMLLFSQRSQTISDEHWGTPHGEHGRQQFSA